MQEIPIVINLISIIIIVGIFLGVFTSYFLITKSWKKNTSNLLMGFFMLSISMAMFEGWLNYTGFIFKYLWLSNFAEPANFIFAPLLYLFSLSQFTTIKKRKNGLHFIPFVLWSGYCFFYFIQPDVFKYNSNIQVMQLDIPPVDSVYTISDDPIGIRNYVNELTAISFIIYIFLTLRLLYMKSKSIGQSLFKSSNTTLRSQRRALYHFTAIIAIFIFVKGVFEFDVRDHFIHLYLSFMFIMTTVQIINKSTYFNEVSTFLQGPAVLKYQKSSLSDEQKEIILKAISEQMKNENYYKKSTASLSGLAKAVNESSHHISQVINEKLGQSFFEMLATYRVEEAQEILSTELGKKLTIEEVAEQVGYNSKSAFNNAFKKITSKTPSEFRDL
jgi:AraC-type DNA-binding domain-containing proteins